MNRAAAELGLTVATPASFRKPEVLATFAALDLDAAVVVAYGQILPVTALEAPRRGCLNLHASLLPRWRGAAPIQRAIMAGDAETGVCVMQMEAGLDTGPVFACVRLRPGRPNHVCSYEFVEHRKHDGRLYGTLVRRGQLSTPQGTLRHRPVLRRAPRRGYAST